MMMQKQCQKYRLEDNSDRLKKQLLPKWIRTQLFEFTPMKWNIEIDNLSNDFEPIVKEIVASKKSINIEGRAGVGKSHFINTLKTELDIVAIKRVPHYMKYVTGRALNYQNASDPATPYLN